MTTVKDVVQLLLDSKISIYDEVIIKPVGEKLCINCEHQYLKPHDEPCRDCNSADKWEPKPIVTEVDVESRTITVTERPEAVEPEKSCDTCGWDYDNICGAVFCTDGRCSDVYRPLLRFKDGDEALRYVSSWLHTMPSKYCDELAAWLRGETLTVKDADSFITRMENTNDGGR